MTSGSIMDRVDPTSETTALFQAYPAEHRRKNSRFDLPALQSRRWSSVSRLIFGVLWLVSMGLMASVAPLVPTVQWLSKTTTSTDLGPLINPGAAPYTDPSSPGYTRFQVGEVEAKPDPEWEPMRSWKLQPGQDLSEQEQCLTWAERYSEYLEPLPSTVPVPPTRTTTALMLRIRPHKLFEPVSNDTLVNLRSLVKEVQMAGIDMYIVVNIPPEWNVDDEWRKQLHPEFADRVLAFVWEDWVDQFLPNTFRDMVYDNHVSSSWFYNSTIGQQYQFLWWLESDVRQTGSWPSFFNHLNASIPSTEPEPYWWELRKHKVSNSTERYQPDLILTWLHDGKPMFEEETVGPGPKCLSFARPEELGKAFIMLFGYSRKLHDISMDYYRTGHSCFCEQFLTTVAKRHHLPIFEAMVPAWRNLPRTMVDVWTWGHWQEWAARPYYQEWKANPSVCRPGPAIMHKVPHT